MYACNYFSTKIEAANLSWGWAKPIGGTGLDRISAMTTDASGNVYIAGEFYGPTLVLNPTVSLTNTGNSLTGNMYVAKYDSAGNLLWAKNGGGVSTNSVAVSGIAVSPNGNNVYVVGNYEGFGMTYGGAVFNHASAGNFAFYLKISGSTGSAMSNDDIQNARMVSVEADANAVYIAGSFSQASISMGLSTITNPNPGSSEIFIAKLGGFSTFWTHTIGGSGTDIPSDIHLGKNGDLFVTGTFSGIAAAGSTTLTSNGSSDMLVAKYDASGNLAWAKNVGGVKAEVATSVSDDNDNVYVTGSFLSPNFAFAGNTINHSNGINGENMLLVKYAANGIEVWAKAAGSATVGDEVVPAHVSVDTADNVYVAGSYSSASISFGSITLNTLPNFLVKYDPAGSATWGQDYEGLDVNYMKADKLGNVYLAGEYSLPLTLGSNNLSPIGGSDVWVAKMIAPITPVAVSETLKTAKLQVYPSPASKEITIVGEWKHANIVIVDMAGKIVYRNSSVIPCKIDVSGFAVGNYQAAISTLHGVISSKFTVAK